MATGLQGPVVFIVGQTGVGKSALSLELAKYFNGEIIAADSRTVYKGMNVGTAKPTPADRELILHHCLDIVEPSEKFSVYDFKALALAAIDSAHDRGKLPFVVGGTGLYVDALLYDFIFRPMPDATVHAHLASLSVEELQRKIAVQGLPMPENASNPLHLRRLLESGIAPTNPRILRPNTLVIGLRVPREELRARIERRAAGMIADGLLVEAKVLYEKYGRVNALRAPAYNAAVLQLEGHFTDMGVEREVVRSDMQFAKRQYTWFKRNKHINWIDQEDKLTTAVDLITTFMNERHISSSTRLLQ